LVIYILRNIHNCEKIKDVMENISYANNGRFMNTVMCMSGYRLKFGLEIGFDYFNKLLVTAINKSAIPDIHTLQITAVDYVSSVCCVFIGRSLLMASNSGYSSASALTLLLTAPNKSFLHRFPYDSLYSCSYCPPHNISARTEKKTPFIFVL
jgi:hypothetical protein